MRLSKRERELITSFLKKATIKRNRDPKMRIIGFPALFRLCSPQEKLLLKRMLEIDPRRHGFRGERYGIFPPPRDLVMIRRERIPRTTTHLSSGAHFLPRKVREAYNTMNRAMTRDIGRRVFVLSGYRSPAYQLVVFLESLTEHHFDIKKVAKRVALPGYSEHGAPKTQAIDLTTLVLRGKGTSTTAFEKTKEYQWLKKRGGEFGFALSYPRGNTSGVIFEPWHWHYGGE
jgi:hypothetical protein